MKENILIDKSIVFASRIVKLHQYLIYNIFIMKKLNEHIKSHGLTTMMWSDMIQDAKYTTVSAISTSAVR